MNMESSPHPPFGFEIINSKKMKFYLVHVVAGLLPVLHSFLSPANAYDETTYRYGGGESLLPYDVVIVGAGWCGMAAARTLEENGMTNYKVLEATDRIGGRTQTAYEEIDGETVPLDMATQWMNGAAQNPLYEFALKAGVSMVLDNYETNVYQSKNLGLIPGADSEGLTEISDRYWYFERDYRKKMKKKGMEDEPLEIVFSKFRRTLTNLNERLMFNYIVKAWYEIEYAAHQEDMSLYLYDVDSTEDDTGWEYEAFWLKDWSSVVETYAEPIRNKIQTKAVVNRIHYKQGLTRVLYSTDDGETVTIKARKVIVTVSLGVLKQRMITFRPALPTQTKRIIDRIGMGTGNHVWMFFDEAFWPEDELGSFFGDGEDRENFHIYYNNLAQRGLYNKPGLMAAYFGQDAFDAEQRFRDSGNKEAYNEEVKNLCMEPLRNMFGEDIPDPEYVFASTWMTNPYTHGIFSFNQVGQKATDKKNLREPINDRLYFAGEHTSEAFYGWVHGAYWEGVAVAEKILREYQV